MALTKPPRRMRGLAVAACAALTLPLLAIAPAAAQTSTTTTTVYGETAASALRITINLPEGNVIQLLVDPVSGVVRTVTGQSPEARAFAAILAGSIGDQGQAFGEALAMLPEPLTANGGPLADLNDGINSSELGEFLEVEVLGSEAEVTPTPTSESAAGTALSLGLPQQLADGLSQVFEPLIAGLEEILAGLEPTDEATQALCEGLTQVTDPVIDGGAGDIPVLGPILVDATDGLADPEIGTLCNLRNYLVAITAELEDALSGLGGVGGILSIDTLFAAQEIVTEGTKVTATATAEAGDITLLPGTVDINPLGEVEVLTTTSTAMVDGQNAEATVEADAVTIDVDPIALIDYDLEDLEGQLIGIELDGLNALLDQIEGLLEALAGIGIEGGRLGSPDDAIAECPEALDPNLSGTFEAEDGTCAAAAARGYGLALVAPEELVEALGLAGPLVEVTFVPTAALARIDTTTTTAPPPPQPVQGQLPRTGPEALLAIAGLALVFGAALVRRRRTAAVEV
jgi:hypothetical protein